MANIITNGAVAIITNLLSGIGGTVPKFIGWGTAAGTSARTDTTLFTETYSTSNNGSGNTRVTGSVSRTTTTLTNDTMQITGTLTCPSALAPLSITNAGVFDALGTAVNLTTAPSGANLFLKSDFGAVSLANTDTIAFTFTIQFS